MDNEQLVERLSDMARRYQMVGWDDGKTIASGVEYIKLLQGNLEGIESERNQYLDWFALHGIDVTDVLDDLRAAAEDMENENE